MKSGTPQLPVDFFPVVNLLTGPPGLSRNGGIWRDLKRNLRLVQNPPNLMVQALHFVTYDLSEAAWEEWFAESNGRTRIESEMQRTFGTDVDAFIDSGGFQTLRSDLIDLEKWGLEFRAEEILDLQLRFSPGRVASFDLPIGPLTGGREAWRRQRRTIENAKWALEALESRGARCRFYVAVHGRNPSELGRFFRQLERRIDVDGIDPRKYGIALGSQVPLSPNPQQVVENIERTLAWMEGRIPERVPLHVFGVGDAIVGEILRRGSIGRRLSYDNSTYVQNAFRLRWYDASHSHYRLFDAALEGSCRCSACALMHGIGEKRVSELLSSRPYLHVGAAGDGFNKSSVLALIALHNLSHWQARVRSLRPRAAKSVGPAPAQSSTDGASRPYEFPLGGFKARAPTLLLLPCSKTRPYAASRSHREVAERLMDLGLEEARDYDRVTLSGIHGPVHWKDERLPLVMDYDFPLSAAVSDAHVRSLRVRTATFLGLARRRYAAIVAYLRNSRYREVFGPTVLVFKGQVASDLKTAGRALHEVT